MFYICKTPNGTIHYVVEADTAQAAYDAIQKHERGRVEICHIAQVEQAENVEACLIHAQLIVRGLKG